MSARADLRDLPSVDALAGRLDAPHPVAVAAARAVIADRRAELVAGTPGGEDLDARARAWIERAARPSLRRVLNATGVLLHTNLGRAPLAAAAREAVTRAAEGYSNLELDLEGGGRGSRHDHVEGLVRELTGAEAALAVNNGAGAVLLAAAALAGPGREVVVSRGQLVEIGGGFRIPDVIAQAGARLVEVGTTNRTRLGRLRGGAHRAHRGGPARPSVELPPARLRRSGRGRGAVHARGARDRRRRLGGARRREPALAEEPAVRRSVAAGAALVCFSGDKLLGGPQAGVMAGTADAVARAKAHPLARALRLDKLSLAALEATLRLYRDPAAARAQLPVLAMLTATDTELSARAERVAEAIGPAATVARSTGRVGGGALPLLELEGPVTAVIAPSPDALALRLRAGDPPVLARIEDDRLLLDPRTLTDAEADQAAVAVRAALDAG